MSTTPTLHFVVLTVSDLDAALKYFTETLGFEHDPQQDAPDFRGFKLPAGSPPFGLIPVSPEYPYAGTIGVYFKINNLEGMQTDLTEKGIKTTEIRQEYFGSIFGVDAPDGLRVTMIRPAGP